MQSLNRLKESPSQTAGPYVHIGCVPNFCGIEGVYPEDLGTSMATSRPGASESASPGWLARLHAQVPLQAPSPSLHLAYASHVRAAPLGLRTDRETDETGILMECEPPHADTSLTLTPDTTAALKRI